MVEKQENTTSWEEIIQLVERNKKITKSDPPKKR